jgi:hypothetical protein
MDDETDHCVTTSSVKFREPCDLAGPNVPANLVQFRDN